MRSKHFNGRHFEDLIILQCLRWYLKYPISYRQLSEMMSERGVDVNHTTIYRWIQHYSPHFEKEVKRYAKPLGFTWHVDETYIKVKGRWKYLYRAIDGNGHTIDFMLSHKQNTKFAVYFFKKVLKNCYEHPSYIHTDQHRSLVKAVKVLKQNDVISPTTEHITDKASNNRIESDHFRIKRIIRPMLGFKSFHTANRCIKGLEAMLMVVKNQTLGLTKTLQDQIKFIHKLFDVHTV